MYRLNTISSTLKSVLSNVDFIRTAANTLHNAIYKNNYFVRSLQPCMPVKYRCHKILRETKKYYLLAVSLPTLLKSIFHDDEDKDEKTSIIMALKRSQLLIESKEFAKAEQMLHVALHQAQTVQCYEAITYIYDVMANLAFETGDYRKAETLFTTLLQRLISNGVSENDMRVIHISLKMAYIFDQSGETKKAKLGYMFCLEHLQSHIEQNPEDIDALSFLIVTLDCKTLHGDKYKETVRLLHTLGYICYLQEKYDEAMNYLSAAVEIGKDLNIYDLGYMNVSLGYVFLQKGLYNEAKRLCQEGRKIADNHHDNDTLSYADNCLNQVKKLLSL
ncbi:tetratricopeptide repeat protein 19 homolog, mitochondrial isoform X2 [Harpegnathos saltator]|uniref:tetratricopeptide repeat protein 19 homolog, mitochondrial isoform X2 n=1 Tax=Harpegnathos saltator TaxID=610380 RepID=UPI000DBED819|nr:tetratricopeptide repeat protein 19 homolog, mitochondrial isoform X2 [Harpegnathos saltator]